MITVFQNIRQTTGGKTVPIEKVYQAIKNCKQVELIGQIRGGNKDKKKDLPCIMFAGEFKGRKDTDLVKHSGRAILDFDHVDVNEYKADLKQYPFIEAIFTSPSGDGVKAVARIPDNPELHKKVYDALLFELGYLNPDPTSRNVARVCFASCDPDIHINENAEVFDKQLAHDKYVILERAGKMIRNAADGEKHNTLIKASKLLGGYVASQQIDYNEASEYLENQILARDIEDADNARRAIRDGLSYGENQPIAPKLVTTSSPTVKFQESTGWTLKPISDYKREYVKAKTPDENPLTMGFQWFDQQMKHKYRGKVGAFIGYGGTKKSLMLQNIAIANARKGKRSIYSQMEMGVADHMDRWLNMIFGNSIADELEERERETKGHIYDWYEDNLEGTPDADRLLQTTNSGLQASDYREMIEYTKDRYGDVDLLCIDGLSMMGGDPRESETERYSRHTKELKEIANEYNIFIGLICHVARGKERHTRDVSRYVRGSEKILDNIDFVMNFSLVADDYQQESLTYRQDVGWIRLWDKRGGGGTHDRIYTFNPASMKMIESGEDPSIYESKGGKDAPF